MAATVRAGDTTLVASALLDRLGLADQVGQTLVPVIAYGSNANVDALTRKFVTSDFAGPAVIPVVKATLSDFDVAWSPQFVANGAMPATIVPSRGTRVSVWVTWMDSAELAQMNATEDVGSLYSFGYLSSAHLMASGPALTRMGLYVDCFGALAINGHMTAVKGVSAHGRHLRALDSAGALRSIAESIGWHGSVYSLLLDNVRSASDRVAHTRALATHAVKPTEPGYVPIDRCVSG